MAAPSVYAAINAVSAELARSGIAKTHTNAVDDYKYRSIDDVLDRLAPLLAEHRLCILPRVLAREVAERRDEMERPLFHASVKVAFSLTSVDDGSSHVVESYGEALDPTDKATAKAMSAAYKSAMVQTFCIPCAPSDEPDTGSYRVSSRTHVAEPVQGWRQWATDLTDIVSLCESVQAIDVVQKRNRELLKALSREQHELYAELGINFERRRHELSNLSAKADTRIQRKPTPRSKKNKRELEDA